MIKNRRGFLGYTLALGTSATAFGGTELLTFLTSPSAVERVHQILKEHLRLENNHLNVVMEFTKSLRTTHAHTESPAVFEGLLKRPSAYENIETYVIQEFVVSTNYLAYKAGEADTLSLVRPNL